MPNSTGLSFNNNQHGGVEVTVYALQSLDMGLIPLSSHTENIKK